MVTVSEAKTHIVVFEAERDPDGGFTAQALGEDIFTQADSIEELKAAVEDAVACHFADRELPDMIRLYIRETILPRRRVIPDERVTSLASTCRVRTR
jgi:predicted RNase H-like HicB family nuclease